MTDKIFPIELPAFDGPHYTESSRDFRKVFLAAFKKSDLKKWYAYDVRIDGLTTVTFTVYDMYDNCYGSIGKKIGVIENVEVSKVLTKPFIDKKIWQLATDKRAKELAEKEEKHIRAHADKIRFDAGLWGL